MATPGAYGAWWNGELLGRGPIFSIPPTLYVDEYEVQPEAGGNALVLEVHHEGESNFVWIDRPPFVLVNFLVDGVEFVPEGLRCEHRSLTGFRQGPLEKLDIQLGFSFHYDARKSSDWQPVTAANFPAHREYTLVPRPVPYYPNRSAPSVGRHRSGLVLRACPEGATPAEHVQKDEMILEEGWHEGFPKLLCLKPAKDAGGICLFLEWPEEICGYFFLDLEGPEGAVLDIGYGEHLRDGRVAAFRRDRHFAFRYVCREGRQCFSYPFKRISGRYLQIHGRNLGEGALTVYGFAIHPAIMPLEERGAFSCSDEELCRLNEAGLRTLRLCMHDHYEDTPWREQGLYANDMMIQAHTGYHAFGNYAYAGHCIRLLGQSLREDDWLELCAPARFPVTPPAFTMDWVVAVWQHYLYSGDDAFLEAMFPLVRRVLERRLGEMKDDLLPCPQGPAFWHFYDWMPGLDGTVDGDCTQFESIETLRYFMPLQAKFLLALEGGIQLAKYGGGADFAMKWQGAAEKVRARAEGLFFDRSPGIFKTRLDGLPQVHVLTQALALLAGLPRDVADRERLAAQLVQPPASWVAATFSQSYFLYRALLEEGAISVDALLGEIKRRWLPMLTHPGATFWETEKGDLDFDGAGSLCHGWSASPVYFFSAWLLGIRPLEPGFRRFLVAPQGLAEGFMEGKVPTPQGDIGVTWGDEGGKKRGRLEYPSGTCPEYGGFQMEMVKK